ncbi:carbohydrate ABC transporter permease [Virgibacillus sp. NKC19-3]|uniref:carbohydrate ABC transporter permease n=1 Tax=Virgibacillus saliphilus TaxID=2831674 RepID=UPI001C9B0617|nr:carbohydrate ABC transporter permease [Virgibacillus sp. NKC19-3]MBY7144212.1 carbohydrate ABC transporter permease [Virgibacillus sp. NKC19-3]
MSSRNTKNINRLMIYIVLFVFSMFVIIPVLWMLSTAVKPMTEVFTTPPKWIPNEITWEAFVRMWTDYPFVYYFINSFLVVSVATVISLLFSALAGFGASRFSFRGKGSFLIFLLLTQMFPSIMLLIPFYKIFGTLGIVNTHIGLILTYITFTLPLCSWMLMGYFNSIPKEIDDAAAIDGCGKLRTFIQIVLPLSLPGVVATAIYCFIVGWNEYMFALVLINDEALKTVPVGIGELIGEYKVMWPDLMAASLVATIPLLIVFLFLQKYFISGLTGGSVK